MEKNQKQLYFTDMGSAPCWADFIKIWFDVRDRQFMPNFVNKSSESTMLQGVEIRHFPLTLAVAVITVTLLCYRDN